MKDKLNDLFHERFAGHEADVPPGAWEAISTQVAAASGAGMQGSLQDKFSGHELEVDPGVWQNISSQLGHGAVAGAAAGTSAGWLAAGLAAVVVGGGLLYWTLSPSTPATEQKQMAVTVEQPAAVAPVAPAEAARPTEQQASPLTASNDQPANTTSAKRPESTNTSAALPAVEPQHTVTNNAATGSTGTASAEPKPSEQGQQTVTEVMQQLMAENATRPEPAKPEAVPPPSINDVPIQPFPSKDEAPATIPETPMEEPAVQAEEPTIFIPNVFSPNGDGVNDRLEVKCEHCQAVEVRVFSAKTNALVFKARDLEHAWNGQGADDGYYFYAIEITGEDGKVRSKGEVVRLFRP